MEKFEEIKKFQSETISGSVLYDEIYDRENHKTDPRFEDKSKGGSFHYSPFESELHDEEVYYPYDQLV